MNPLVKNVLALIAGVIIGGVVNMTIVSLSGSILPLPEGVDPNDIESIRANIGEYSIGNLLLPIIAHALGSLTGAFTAAKIAAKSHKFLAIIVSAFFLIGGVMMVAMIPEAPLWMKATDLILAYIPMGWLGWKMSGK